MPPNLLYRRHATSTLTPKREDTIMDTKTTPIIMRALLFTVLLVAFAATAFAQTTTGTVSMSATVSKFVEFNSGGAITLTGNSGGGITTDGVVDNPLAASINLGELGPSNTNGLTVPAMFAIKPQFYENGSTTVSVTFTVTTP